MGDLATYDWLVTDAWDQLHHAELDAASLAAIEDGCIVETVILSCGDHAESVRVPGFLSRIHLPRCSGCCRATGLPEGIGSPKNDKACRALLGLE